MPRITPRSSLEDFRAEARRWLKALRKGDPEARVRLIRVWPDAPSMPGLRQVQHALALEFGRASWAQLKRDSLAGAHRSVRLSVARCIDVAADLVKAQAQRDAEALTRVNETLMRAMSLEDLDAEVWRRVYAFRQRVSRGGERALLLEEAEILLAQDAGFASWRQLLDSLEGKAQPAAPYGRDGSSVRLRRRLTSAEWERLIADMREQRVRRLEGDGAITDAAMIEIAGLEHLEELSLGGSPELTDTGLQHLARMPQLERLTINGSGRLTEHGLAVVSRLPHLRHFESCWQQAMTDAAAAHLEHCEQLEEVNLMGTSTGDGAVAALAGKKSLRRLMTGRLLSDVGLSLLRKFPRFTAWRGEPAHIDADDIAGEAGSLHIDGPFTDSGLEVLAELSGVYELNIFWHATGITSKGIARIKTMQNLGAFGADGALLDDEGMAHVGSLPKLRRLRAQETPASDAGFEALARSQTLQSLWTRDAGPGERGFFALCRMPSLRRLGVSLKRVEDDALSHVSELAELREITPIDITDDGFRHIAKCERLERLTCMYCRDTTDIATLHVRDLKLRRYYAGLTRITDMTLEILGRMPTLEIAEFYETKGVTDAGLAQLAKAPQLKAVQFDHLPGITAGGVGIFGPRVKTGYTP